MAQGWISIHRQLQGHWVWDDKPYSRGQAWIDMLLMANHEDKTFMFGNELINVQAGSFITSIAKLCTRWGWSNTKVVKFLELLESDEMLTRKSDAKKTVITIVKYGFYQESNDEKTMKKRCRNDAETMLKHTNNNDNNDNKYKKKDTNVSKEKAQRFIPPTRQEVTTYCVEKGYSIDVERFIDYYTANGWMVGKNKMKDWKACVRNWNRGQRQGMTTEAQKSKFRDFEQREYDVKKLTNELLNIGAEELMKE